MTGIEKRIKERWEGAYKDADFTELPWETNKPDAELVKRVAGREIRIGRVLDLCCGAGTHSIYLAKNGFDVFGVDVSANAVQLAMSRARDAQVRISFSVGNAYGMGFQEGSFTFVFDRGCFHHIPPEFRRKYVEGVYEVLEDGGRYLMMCFSDKNGWNQDNVFSFDRIRSYFSSHFRILDAEEVVHVQPDGSRVILWAVFMEKLISVETRLLV